MVRELPKAETHVWRFPLTSQGINDLNHLTPEEVAFSAKFAFPHLQEFWILGRQSVRRILSLYLDCRPEEIIFLSGPQGKPYLKDFPNLHFNFSNSGEWGVIALTRDREIGVDIEKVDSNLDIDEVSQVSLTETERRHLSIVPPSEKSSWFFKYWTVKEAVLKALGTGLSLEPTRLCLSLEKSKPEMLWIEGQENVTTAWDLKPLSLPEGYFGFVAIEQKALHVKEFEWPFAV
mgnify:CR=1 FL=1